ncbi:MAG TPA: hypothetical protein VGL38_07995 [bacterium]|jgi:predicted nucleotidyltransferase
MSIWKDISATIDPATAGLIADLDAVLRPLSIEYMLVGAAARDAIFQSVFNIHTGRKTVDVDFSVQVAAWVNYEAMASALVVGKKFTKDTKQRQRFFHHPGTVVDLIPFGGIEDAKGAIAWPPDGGFVMQAVGMREAMDNAVTLRVRSDPSLDIKVCSPVGMAILKLISWADRKTRGGEKDAVDLLFLMREYLNVPEIHPRGDDSDIWSEERPFEEASARLLGRHIASLASTSTRTILERILIEEARTDGSMLLAMNMAREQLLLGSEDSLAKALLLIRELLAGMR